MRTAVQPQAYPLHTSSQHSGSMKGWDQRELSRQKRVDEASKKLDQQLKNIDSSFDKRMDSLQNNFFKFSNDIADRVAPKPKSNGWRNAFIALAGVTGASALYLWYQNRQKQMSRYNSDKK